MAQKPTSSKTRIKTFTVLTNFLKISILRNQLPVKQGLRHCIITPYLTHIQLRNQLPVKQGLRLIIIKRITQEGWTQKPTSSKTRIKTRQ